MRIIAFIVCLIVTPSVAYLAGSTQSTDRESITAVKNPLYTDLMSTRDRSLFDGFMATLDPTIIKECVAKHDAGGEVDLDILATCGDFDLYARYMRISKFEAVKKFQYVLLCSSSKIEFEDRLAR